MTLKKKHTASILIVLILIGIRLWLPEYILHKINQQLQDLGEYTGQVEDIDLHLFRGAYIIDSIHIIKQKTGETFFSSPRIDLSIEWKSLFRGAIVSEIWVEQPQFIFKFHPNPSKQQTGSNTDWTDLVADLVPIRINTFALRNGCAFATWQAHQIDVCELNLDLINIQNVIVPDSLLPSELKLTGHIAPFSGDLSVTGNANLLSGPTPNFDLNGEIESLDLTKGSALLRSWTNLDFENGTLSVYSELKHQTGDYRGYIKPILRNAKIFALTEEDRSLWEAGLELVAQGVQEIFENQEKETNASRYPFNGTLETTTKANWTAVWTILQNAFWKALKAEIDHSVDYSSTSESQ